MGGHSIVGPLLRDYGSSYTMPTMAVWDLSAEPEGKGNKSHMAPRGSGILSI